MIHDAPQDFPLHPFGPHNRPMIRKLQVISTENSDRNDDHIWVSL